MGSIRLIGSILEGSPWWVYKLLALPVYLGLQAHPLILSDVAASGAVAGSRT